MFTSTKEHARGVRAHPRGARQLAFIGLAALVFATAGFPAMLEAAPTAPRPGATETLDSELSRRVTSASDSERIPVIVEAATDAAPSRVAPDANRQRAQRARGSVEQVGAAPRARIDALGVVTAELTPSQIRRLAGDKGVARITFDAPVRAASVDVNAAVAAAGAGTPIVFPEAIGAPEAWRKGFTGRGVTVAVLDTGIAQNPAFGNRVKRRVDLVSPGQPVLGDPAGHGTHIAGIIAGTDPARGVAPDADLVSVRVLNVNGQGRLSTVMGGLAWTIANKSSLGIRVAVLALSAPASGSYQTDPLAGAVELAWRAGIVVVNAAGNDGPAAGTVDSPGIDPLILTVGATDDRGTASVADDTVPDFSSRGPTADGLAKPDLVAPGRKIVSLRVPGSTLDTLMPTHIEGPQAIRVTGTSQATAVTAGAVAVLLQQRPQLSPDAVKAVLVGSAHTLTGTARNAQGAGSVDVAAAILAPTPRVKSQPTRVSHAFARSVLPLLRSQVVRVQGRQIQWDQIQWDQIQWDQIQWDQIQWDQIQWDQIQWDQIQWDAAAGSQPLGTVPLD